MKNSYLVLLPIFLSPIVFLVGVSLVFLSGATFGQRCGEMNFDNRFHYEMCVEGLANGLSMEEVANKIEARIIKKEE